MLSLLPAEGDAHAAGLADQRRCCRSRSPDSPLPLWIGAGNLELPTPDLLAGRPSRARCRLLPAPPTRAGTSSTRATTAPTRRCCRDLTDNPGDFNGTLVVSRSDDGDHVVVDSFNQLTPDAPGRRREPLRARRRQRRAWSGSDRTARRSAGGVTSPSPGGDTATTLPFQNAISADGSRIVFLDPSNSHLYVRIDGERTVALPELPVGALTNGRQTFYYATPDGSKIAFTNAHQHQPRRAVPVRRRQQHLDEPDRRARRAGDAGLVDHRPLRRRQIRLLRRQPDRQHRRADRQIDLRLARRDGQILSGR